jgi:hypothetical protein
VKPLLDVIFLIVSRLHGFPGRTLRFVVDSLAGCHGWASVEPRTRCGRQLLWHICGTSARGRTCHCPRGAWHSKHHRRWRAPAVAAQLVRRRSGRSAWQARPACWRQPWGYTLGALKRNMLQLRGWCSERHWRPSERRLDCLQCANGTIQPVQRLTCAVSVTDDLLAVLVSGFWVVHRIPDHCGMPRPFYHRGTGGTAHAFFLGIGMTACVRITVVFLCCSVLNTFACQLQSRCWRRMMQGSHFPKQPHPTAGAPWYIPAPPAFEVSPEVLPA